MGYVRGAFGVSYLYENTIQEEVTIIVIILQISIPELLILIIKIMSLGHNGDDEITVVLSRQVLDSAMHTRDPKAQQTT